MDEFKFPDEIDESKKASKEAEDKIEIVIEGDEPEAKAEPKKAEKAEAKVEVVDDTPQQDRNRKPSDPPEEVTDEELEGYSDRVKKRIKHFSKGFHDQRRLAEEAQREREEALRLAKALMDENNKLKGTVENNQKVLLEQAKRAVSSEIEEAKRAYKDAYEAGDTDKIIEAQEKLTLAKIRADKVNSFKPPLQEQETAVQTQQIAPEPVVDTKAANWQKSNPWFGSDDEMTSFALGLHQKLVKQGVDPRSDDYYERINARMRQVFPSQFEPEETEEVEVEEPPRRKTQVVAPATRSTAPKKIVLTKTQVALAKKLGVPLELYAKQVAEAARNQNG